MENIEKIIKIPAEQWRGKCHQIAGLLLTNNIVSGKLRYGHWIGPVQPGSVFFGRPVGCIHHGWIECPDRTIIDPTRFEFEQVKPYIYIGRNDYYDAGGNQIRLKNLKPAPEWDPKEHRIIVLNDNNSKLSIFVKSNINCRSTAHTIVLQIMQAFWLANLPLQVLGEAAKPVYTALIEANQGGLIPFDNKQMVMEES